MLCLENGLQLSSTVFTELEAYWWWGDWLISLTTDGHTSRKVVFRLFWPSLFKGEFMKKGMIHRLELEPRRLVINNENWDLWAKLCIFPLCQLLCWVSSVKEACWILLDGKIVTEDCKPIRCQLNNLAPHCRNHFSWASGSWYSNTTK